MKTYQQLMDDILTQEVSQGIVNGAVALVYKDGKEIYYGAAGMADVEKGMAMNRDTIIRLFSMSKPITAAAVMILAERGLIELQAPLSMYLPEFKNQSVAVDELKREPVHREIMIMDLLNMTSGIPYPEEATPSGRMMGKVFYELIQKRIAGETVTTRDWMKEVSQVPLCFQPGEKWMYGFSADVLGAVVEAVSGMTYGEFLRKELFEPLEMMDTGFYVPEEKKNRYAQIYEWNEEKGKLEIGYDGHLGCYYEKGVAFESGGAGLVSTIEDYSHFCQMLANGGSYKGKRILGTRTVKFMSLDALTEQQKIEFNWDSLKGYGYGCLMRSLQNPAQEGVNSNAGCFGWDGWTGNYMVVDPTDKLTLLYFIQRAGAGTMPVIRKLRMVTNGYLDRIEE